VHIVGVTITLNTEAEYLAAVATARNAAAAYYDTAVQTMADARYDELIEQITATEQTHPQWAASDGLPIRGARRYLYRRRAVAFCNDRHIANDFSELGLAAAVVTR